MIHWNPFSPILNHYKKYRWGKIILPSFLQRVGQTFGIFHGPILPKSPVHFQMGIVDYLFPLPLLCLVFSSYLSRGSRREGIISTFGYVLVVPFTVLGVIILTALEIIKLIICTAFTLVSLPFIGMVHYSFRSEAHALKNTLQTLKVKEFRGNPPSFWAIRYNEWDLEEEKKLVDILAETQIKNLYVYSVYENNRWGGGAGEARRVQGGRAGAGYRLTGLVLATQHGVPFAVIPMANAGTALEAVFKTSYFREMRGLTITDDEVKKILEPLWGQTAFLMGGEKRSCPDEKEEKRPTDEKNEATPLEKFFSDPLFDRNNLHEIFEFIEGPYKRNTTPDPEPLPPHHLQKYGLRYLAFAVAAGLCLTLCFCPPFAGVVLPLLLLSSTQLGMAGAISPTMVGVCASVFGGLIVAVADYVFSALAWTVAMTLKSLSYLGEVFSRITVASRNALKYARHHIATHTGQALGKGFLGFIFLMITLIPTLVIAGLVEIGEAIRKNGWLHNKIKNMFTFVATKIFRMKEDKLIGPKASPSAIVIEEKEEGLIHTIRQRQTSYRKEVFSPALNEASPSQSSLSPAKR